MFKKNLGAIQSKVEPAVNPPKVPDENFFISLRGWLLNDHFTSDIRGIPMGTLWDS